MRGMRLLRTLSYSTQEETQSSDIYVNGVNRTPPRPQTPRPRLGQIPAACLVQGGAGQKSTTSPPETVLPANFHARLVLKIGGG